MTKNAAQPVRSMNGTFTNYAYNNVVCKEKLFYAIYKPR